MFVRHVIGGGPGDSRHTRIDETGRLVGSSGIAASAASALPLLLLHPAHRHILHDVSVEESGLATRRLETYYGRVSIATAATTLFAPAQIFH